MKKFEYEIFKFDEGNKYGSDHNDWIRFLNKHGKDGWECIETVDSPPYAIFKRELI